MTAGAIPTVPAVAQESAHALLSASGAHRWLHCTPSARLEEQFPDRGSEYAAEGTLAHAVAELTARKHFVEPMGPRKYAAALKKLQEDPLYQDEMLRHAETYLDYLSGIVHGYASRPYIALEKRLDYSHIAPEGFGTGDCIIIGGDTLHVIDYKYGKGVPVSAEENPQMMLYALGALAAYVLLYDIRRVKLAIVQPRLDTISEWELPAEDLQAWGESIKPAAIAAYAGGGEYCAGDWCRFCRAKAQCRARANTLTALEAFGGAKPPLLTNDEIGDILRRAQTLQAWVSDLEEYALSACLAGESIDGWKAVEGRSVRQFADSETAFAAVTAAGYDEALLYERRPLSLAGIEKLLGKAKFAQLLADHVVTPPGKPTLAPETDKRQAITNRITAADAFGAEN